MWEGGGGGGAFLKFIVTSDHFGQPYYSDLTYG